MDREEILKILSSYKLSKAEIEYLYLQLYFTEQLNNKADEQIQEFHVEQKENRDSILNEIAKIMLSYSIVESIMSIGSSDKAKLKSRLNTLIQNKIQSEVNSETLKTKELLESTGKNKYNINNYINDIGTNDKLDINPVEDETLDKISNNKVDNKTWSDRLWDNKNDLQKDLKAEIDDFLNGKTTVNEIEEKIKKKYNKNAYETKRLVHTEIARVQEEINQTWAKEHNIKYQMFMATLDYKTSERCRGLDGKVFEFDDSNKPIPPLHPFCRSTLVNMHNKDWRPSQRLDNESKQKISWQTYEEWKDRLEQNQEIKISKKDINNDYSVNRNLVNSKEYHDKFEKLPLSKQVKENLYIESKKILEHRDGTHYEDLVILDSRTGKEIVSNRSTDNNLRTGLSKEDYEKVMSRSGEIILLHNHPGGGRPSIADIMTAFKQENVKASIVVGHDGSVNIISNINRKIDIEKIYNRYYNEYKKIGYESQHARIKATDEIYSIGIFDYITK